MSSAIAWYVSIGSLLSEKEIRCVLYINRYTYICIYIPCINIITLIKILTAIFITTAFGWLYLVCQFNRRLMIPHGSARRRSLGSELLNQKITMCLPQLAPYVYFMDWYLSISIYHNYHDTVLSTFPTNIYVQLIGSLLLAYSQLDHCIVHSTLTKYVSLRFFLARASNTSLCQKLMFPLN